MCSAFVLVTAALSTGCIDDRSPAPLTFPVATENEAAARVREFFYAYSSGDLDAAAGFICEIGTAERATVKAFISHSHAPNAPIRIDQVEVREVASHWDGEEPTFWVEVAFPMRESKGEINSAYRVRVRSGCIENFVNAIPSDRAPSTAVDDDQGGDDVPARIPALPPPPSEVPTAPPLAQPSVTDHDDAGVIPPPIVPQPPPG